MFDADRTTLHRAAPPGPGAIAAPPRRVSDARLHPTEILFDLDALTKDCAFREIARVIGATHPMSEAIVYAGLIERERLGSTALGRGVAIPHARVAGLTHPVIAFVRVRFPIAFEAPDGRPVSILLVLLVPEQATDAHLALLARAAELFCDDAFREALRHCRHPVDVDATFSRWQNG